MGLPCVASVAARSGTVIPNGEGILATDDPKEFAGHVIRLLRDGNWRAEMARRARAAAEANYRWETQMACLDQIVEKVARPPPRAVPASLERA
jgi:glycosyltransferase involved in cell wall biosynthesis